VAETDGTLPHSILVTVAADRRPDIAALADRMREAGMTVQAILVSIGVVTGTATPAQAAAVAALPGVAAVEPDRAVHLRPPDLDVR
jgi:hypothetical protein